MVGAKVIEYVRIPLCPGKAGQVELIVLVTDAFQPLPVKLASLSVVPLPLLPPQAQANARQTAMRTVFMARYSSSIRVKRSFWASSFFAGWPGWAGGCVARCCAGGGGVGCGPRTGAWSGW